MKNVKKNMPADTDAEKKKTLVDEMYDTALQAGLPVIPFDKCCRLMAWLYVYGGGCEQAVLDERLRGALTYAQNRLCILGGERPDADAVKLIQEYYKSIDYKNPPEWVLSLEAEYGIKISQR